jgi:hypothetical protein
LWGRTVSSFNGLKMIAKEPAEAKIKALKQFILFLHVGIILPRNSGSKLEISVEKGLVVKVSLTVY